MFRLFKTGMAREVSEWLRDGLIEREQAEAILARYGTSLDRARDPALGERILLGLAVLFVGLALVLVVSANWDQIPRALRMGALVAITLGANLVGLRALAGGRDRAAGLWLLFGGLAYGVSMMLIAQIYHLGEHFPDGIYYWALGVLPLAVLLRGVAAGLLVLVLGSLWLVIEAQTGAMPWSYPLFAGTAIWLALTGPFSRTLFLGGLLGLALWCLELYAWWRSGGEAFLLGPDWPALLVVLALAGAAIAADLRRAGAGALAAYGRSLSAWLVFAWVSALLIASFADFWREMRQGPWPVLLAVIAASGAWAAWRNGRDGRVGRWLPVLAASYFATAFALPSMQLAAPIALAVVANLLLVVTAVVLVRAGIERQVGAWFHAGVALLLLTALLRYFDLVGDYLGGAALFLVAAGVLYGAARFWRHGRGGAGNG